MKNKLQQMTVPLYAVLTGLILGAIIMLISGYNPLSAYGSLVVGAFGSASAIGNTLTSAVPLILVGLGIAVAFRAGLFNIGAEGQYWMGAIVAVWIGYHFPTLTPILHITLALLGAMLAGALWGGVIPGLTKSLVGAHEVITTMMLSYIAIFFVHYLLEQGPMMAPGFVPQSRPIAATAALPNLFPATGIFSNATLSSGFLIALAAAAVTHIVLFRTTFGYRLRTVGHNPAAAKYAGMSVTRFTILSLGLSGLLAGLAGGVQMLGVDQQLNDSVSSGFGYTGIVVSLLARNNPYAVILAGIFFAALSVGSQTMQINSGVSANMTDVITGIIVFFVAADRLYQYGFSRIRSRVRAKSLERTEQG
ncbi:ABC transporter permease [Ferroacidibacillus organovorans]|uniref:ABC transporter permease n=1 Tax=Ferroacidibacillus organovorans TaxID=1765683 RepID=A0A162SDY2_9BACL|nr:ABC transporter permease [Ferroacidibacillus organovorans]KYP79739.1 ABC transporter permease [Ferroacidibacillus organovorans]OAG90829.1 ABC transporter permease [Ferroacidibacillus organovorans]OPG15835.1 ABC transporter permease [Ferroacidibacillus organovorans]